MLKSRVSDFDVFNLCIIFADENKKEFGLTLKFNNMTFIIFMMILCAIFDDHDKKPCHKKKSYRRYKKDNSWLDNAWFHDHGQHI